MLGVRLQRILFFAAASAMLLVDCVPHYYAQAHQRVLLATTLVLVVGCALVVRGFDGETQLTLLAAFPVPGIAACAGPRRQVRQ